MARPELTLMEKIVSLAKRRGFVFPGSEIYGGLAGTWDYGPLGVELKRNIEKAWWRRFVQSRADMVGIDAAVIMNSKVWDASGHLKEFSDPLVECKKCHYRFRPDQIPGFTLVQNGDSKKYAPSDDAACPNCGSRKFTESRFFNMMFKTFLGPTEGEDSAVYLRPETAQAMFVNFAQVLDATHRKLPFGIASQGKAFRNEITPGNFIFRSREFNLMEFEYFIRENEWEKWFDYWRNEMREWLRELGVDLNNVREIEVPDGERAHYSQRTVDFEYDYPFGQKELYGLAYRTDFDLRNHEKFSGQNLRYKDQETGEEFWPHIIEPAFGIDRSVLVAILEAHREDGERTVLSLPPKLAPYKAAVFPLLANKPDLVDFARKIFDDLRANSSIDGMIAWDERGNIGKRYFSQDEIGTPWCVTVDFQTLEDDTVTVRDRDTMKQERVRVEELADYFQGKLR